MSRRFPVGHAVRAFRVMPADVVVPPFWLLGSSDHCAELAASLGLGFAFAHHFAHHDAAEALGRYRAGFRRSRWLERPHAILATAAVTAESAAEAERLAATLDFGYVRRAQGEYRPLARRRSFSCKPSRVSSAAAATSPLPHAPPKRH
jgi:alkanesulfonate monooxygenase SsuD/methylene tetrahydromethanopterin reductase-like flavin-dependent oxidoreductase (luciferase family)